MHSEKKLTTRELSQELLTAVKEQQFDIFDLFLKKDPSLLTRMSTLLYRGKTLEKAAQLENQEHNSTESEKICETITRRKNDCFSEKDEKTYSEETPLLKAMDTRSPSITPEKKDSKNPFSIARFFSPTKQTFFK